MRALSADLLRPLDDLAWLLECAALTYTGELKSELDGLCVRIREREDGYTAEPVRTALPQLEAALAAYRADRPLDGAGLLSRVSRAWWQAFAGADAR